MPEKNKDRFGKKCGALGCTESRVFTVHGHKGKRVLCAEHACDYVGEQALQLTIQANEEETERVEK
jgi:hypothetical protein